MNGVAKLWILGLVVGVGGACSTGNGVTAGAEPDGGSPVVLIGQDGSSDDTTYVSRTVVRFLPDGTHTVKDSMISRTEQKAEKAARVAFLSGTATERFRTQGAATQATTCSSADVELFSGAGSTGAEICFYASGTINHGQGPSDVANLADYTYCTSAVFDPTYHCYHYNEWAGYVASMNDAWGVGGSPGCLSNGPAYNSNDNYFPFPDTLTSYNVSPASATNYLWLNQTCCGPGYDTCDTYNIECTSVSTTSNCGSCGNVCASGASCVSGTCQCPTGLTACEGVCVNTQNNPNDCGSCGAQVPFGDGCQGGGICIQKNGNCTLPNSLCCSPLVPAGWGDMQGTCCSPGEGANQTTGVCN